MFNKKIIVVFLMFLVAMPSIFFAYALVKKKLIEYRMAEKLEQENLQTIILDASAVVWLKKDKEILINGEAFDIKKIKREGDRLTISGLYDKEEKKLKKLQDHTHGKNQSNNSLLLLCFTVYYQPTEPINLMTVFLNHKHNWPKYHDKICKLFCEIIVPPPRLG